MRDINVDPTRDLSPKRELELDNGNKYILESKPPHGYWYIHMESGQTAECLQGAYTSFTKASEAVRDYFLKTKSHRTVKKVKEKV